MYVSKIASQIIINLGVIMTQILQLKYMATKSALKYVRSIFYNSTLQTQNTVIFTGSRSPLETLENDSYREKFTKIIIAPHLILSHNIRIIMQWTPGHSVIIHLHNRKIGKLRIKVE